MFFILPLSAVRFQVFGSKFMWMMISNQSDFPESVGSKSIYLFIYLFNIVSITAPQKESSVCLL